jgi:hypothetical protein
LNYKVKLSSETDGSDKRCVDKVINTPHFICESWELVTVLDVRIVVDS